MPGMAQAPGTLWLPLASTLTPNPGPTSKGPREVLGGGVDSGLPGPNVMNRNQAPLDEVSVPLGFLPISQVSFNVSPCRAVYTCS